MYVSMSDNPKGGIHVYAASVSGAIDELLLTDEAVSRLTDRSCSTSCVVAAGDDVENAVSSDCCDSVVMTDDVLSVDDDGLSSMSAIALTAVLRAVVLLFICDLLHRNESHVAVSYTQKTAVKHVQGEKYQFSVFSGKLLYKV